MAQLKDLIITGATRLIGDAFVNKIQITAISAPTSAGGTTYGLGTNGYVLKTNGNSVYWAADNNAGGTVTSVRVQATSPITSSQNTTQTETLNTTIALADAYGDTKNPYGTKTANYVLAGPSSGSAAAPSFRQLGLTELSEADNIKAIEALTDTSGILKKTATNTWTLTSGTTAQFLRGDQTWSNEISGGLLKITNNSNTTTIGSQNTDFCHIYNSTNIPFIFNNDIHVTDEHWLGSTSYPWGGLRLGGTGEIQYQGTKANCTMIRMIDNTVDEYGNGIAIGGGGQTIIGGGESASTIAATLSKDGGEIMYVANDGDVNIFSNVQDGFSTTYYRQATLDTSARFTVKRWDTSGETGVAVNNQNNGYDLRMIVNNGATPDVGLYSAKHGMWLIRTTKDKYTYLPDGYNGTATRLAYSQSALAASAITYLTCWNGYELRAISKAEMANAVDSAHKWVRLGGDTMTGQLLRSASTLGGSWISQRDNGVIGINANDSTASAAYTLARIKFSTKTYAICSERAGNSFGIYGWLNSRTENGTDWSLYINNDTYFHCSTRLYGAVWNDYAEKRNVPEAQETGWRDEESKPNPLAGRCVCEVGDDTMVLTTVRLQKGCKIISDTFGFSIGETETAKTPIAVSGRALVYLYEDREEAKQHIGDFVCSGPNGTVSIMTTEEYFKHPQAVVGTISAIPDYEEWGTGKVKVNGRIWIYVK